MSDKRHSEFQPVSKKKRCGEAKDRDDREEEEQPSEEAGTWVADPTASRERRKVHVRRGQGLASASLQSVGENPFAVMTFQPAVVPAVGDAAEKAGGAAPAASGEGPTVEEVNGIVGALTSVAVAALPTVTPPVTSIFGGSAGATSGFASLAAGGTNGGGSTGSGNFGNGGGIFGGGGLFGLTTPTGGLGKPLFGAVGAGVDEGGEGDEGPDSFEPADDPAIKTVVLAVVEKVTGEENEQTIFAESGKFFEYDSKCLKWRERGNGELRVNISADGTTSRILMRQSGNLRLLLNARITANMPALRMQGNNSVTFACVNSAAVVHEQTHVASGDGEDNEAGGSKGLSRLWTFRPKGEDKMLALLAALEKAKKDHCKQQEEKKDEDEGAADSV